MSLASIIEKPNNQDHKIVDDFRAEVKNGTPKNIYKESILKTTGTTNPNPKRSQTNQLMQEFQNILTKKLRDNTHF